ncbi:type IV secretion system protein [Acinetobacter sp. Leaf130]|uniref:type IV secretion system protein n=1 Tax=Acinetobacter sp. Leaf130 TaxID=1736269 RepID=UPI0006F716F3|nr:type IV secretion system protein [Acinetobacter sp. Leaf130]KQQ65462.1 type IV secretion protein [Acinetobacter sp. Leaf130]
MKMNKIKVSAIALALAFTTNQANAWDVVFDPTAVANMVKQLVQMQQQYEIMKKQYESTTGSYGIGSSTKSVDVVSGSWQDVVANQKTGSFGTAQKTYDKVLTTIGTQGMNELLSNDSYKRNYNTVKTGFAFSDASYNALNEHIANLSSLKNKINSTRNIKEAQDLANAIAIEQGYINSIGAKLSAVQTNLASNSASSGVTSTQSFKTWFGN